MVERQQSRSKWGGRSRGFWVGAGVISLAAAAMVFTYSTLTVQADTPLARPASTLPPAGPSASLSAVGTTPAKPKIQDSGLSGLATWYGEVRDGHWTASGERFDMFAMTAAHKTLPFGTLVRVTDKNTGKSVDVRVNDRGVLPGDHVIDLSYEAAKQLGILRTGVVNVKLDVLAMGPSRHTIHHQ
ncbi:MAG: septal ring lytic transglycosylase RlpA family protein [Terracidiphilus sp.]